MTIPTFPSYMPVPLIAGFSHKPDFGMLVTQMDSGPDKQLPRNSLAIIQRVAQFAVNNLADRNAFEDWVRDDLSAGSSWFNWNDPMYGGVTKLARIVSGQVTYTPVESLQTWTVAFTLETYG